MLRIVRESKTMRKLLTGAVAGLVLIASQVAADSRYDSQRACERGEHQNRKGECVADFQDSAIPILLATLGVGIFILVITTHHHELPVSP